MNTASNREAPPVVLLFGPTAVGKTELLLSAFAGNAEVVSADALQVYRGMDIGTGKPPPAVRERLPHHLIDIRAPDEPYSVADFVSAADQLVPAILGRGKIPIVSGGTAYYLKHFLLGLPRTPPSDPAIRRALLEELERSGLPPLRRELETADPEAAARIAPLDRYRVLRALEVIRQSGRPLSAFALPSEPRSRYRFLVLALERPRDELHRRIEARVEEMFLAGLPEEVRSLLEHGYGFADPGLRGIGYREFAGVWTGGRLQALSNAALDGVMEHVKRNTRRYAKRQATFFRSLPLARWLPAGRPELVREGVLTFFDSSEKGG